MITERVNRGLLTLAGLLTTLAGAGILIAGLGGLGPAVANRPVIAAYGRQLLTRDDLAAWIAITIVGVLLVIVGLYWLRTQLKADRLGRINLEPDRGHGHVRLSGSALTGAITDEAEATSGVEGTHARLVSRRSGTHLHLTVRFNPHMDLRATRRHIETVVLPHARQALDPDPLPTQLRLEIARKGERVR